MKKWNILAILTTMMFPIHLWAEDYSFEVWAKNGVTNQSAANHGDYLFLVKNELSSISLYNLAERRLIYTLHLSPRDERKGESKTVISHCNQSCFGKEKFSKNDVFPLLYVSQRNPNSSTGAFMDVLRIIPYMDLHHKIDSFHIEQVQKIFFPVMTDLNCMGNPNAVIDSKGGYLYTYSRNNRKMADNFQEAVITQFRLPLLHGKDGKIQDVVILHDEDILESFNCGFNVLNAQGGFYRKGKIYFVQGLPSKKEKLNFIYFREIDLKKKRLTRTVDMLNNGFNVEPEGCWYYKGYVMVAGNSKKMYRLTGKKYKVK